MEKISSFRIRKTKKLIHVFGWVCNNNKHRSEVFRNKSKTTSLNVYMNSTTKKFPTCSFLTNYKFFSWFPTVSSPLIEERHCKTLPQLNLNDVRSSLDQNQTLKKILLEKMKLTLRAPSHCGDKTTSIKDFTSSSNLERSQVSRMISGSFSDSATTLALEEEGNWGRRGVKND